MMNAVAPKRSVSAKSQVGDSRVLPAFPGLQVVGALDDTPDGPMEIAMTDDWLAYLNRTVTAKANELHPFRYTHVQLLPDPPANQVIISPCESTAYGAVEFKLRPTEAAAQINLRLAMKVMNVPPLPGRVRIFEVITRKGADGKEYLAFVTKPSTSRPARKRKPEDGEKKDQPGETKADSNNSGQ